MIQGGGLMKNGKGIGASAIALLAVLTAPALAQETPQGDASGQAETGLQDIVVTAQKRAENVQSVPVAITAVSGDMLTAKGISDVASLAGRAPNVTLRSTAQCDGSSRVEEHTSEGQVLMRRTYAVFGSRSKR